MASSKWSLHKFYDRNVFIRKFLPDTNLFNRTTLQRYINQYPAVYIKPDSRHGGNGVIQARKSKNHYSFIRVKGKRVDADSLESLYRKIVSHAIDKKYIIQQAISLATIKGRSFDLRSMMMRKPGGKWKFYGFLAKVAGPNSIITNVCRSRGYFIPIEDALRKSLGLTSPQIKEIKRSLFELSQKISNLFNKYKASTTQIGIDFALDKEKKIWIIEVNFDLPPLSGNMFSKLPDKTNYRAIKKMQDQLRWLRQRKINTVSR